MSFLVWDNEADMQASLEAVNQLFGCSYSEGKYVMERWAEGSKHATEDLWGFSGFKANHLGVKKAQAMDVLIGDYQELSAMPANWASQEGEV